MAISLAPIDVVQPLKVAISVTDEFVKSWGVELVPVTLTSFNADLLNNNVFLYP